MPGLLGDIFSASDQLKRRVYGLLSDPVGTARQTLGMLGDDMRRNIDATNAAFDSRDQQKIAQSMLDNSRTAIGFAPVGMTAWKPGEYQNKLAGLLSDNAGMGKKFRTDDVFGNGSRIDHYDDAKGLMYSEQKRPNGTSRWTTFETFPDSEGGNQVLGNMFQHGSLDDAMAAVRGARISQTLKANNSAKYGAIPNTWDGEAKKVARKLIDSGIDIDRFGSSTQSTSKYIYLVDGRKIRMANHDLPSNYDAADFDHRYGGDIKSLIDSVKQSP